MDRKGNPCGVHRLRIILGPMAHRTPGTGKPNHQLVRDNSQGILGKMEISHWWISICGLLQELMMIGKYHGSSWVPIKAVLERCKWNCCRSLVTYSG